MEPNGEGKGKEERKGASKKKTRAQREREASMPSKPGVVNWSGIGLLMFKNL